ncbi:MAG: tandem-95 repeat protein [Candidatus Thiodiazotropha sp. (ex Dulcina madagascariensis)]|nr:tandem-95 repeat protein [Candidatus Thiodiazotropha sp. (ex Dulcina madagascariensis)]
MTTATEGVAYSYDVDATDADGDALSYSLVTAPAGMTIDSASGLIAWTPAQIGGHPVSVQVDDGNGGTATQSYTVTVAAAPNTAPNITSTPVTTATEGVAYSYDVDATDADGDTLSYSLVTAPASMAIVGTSGLITWTPNSAQLGTHTVSVRVDDGRGGTASQNFTLTVNAVPNTAPSITSTPVTTATEGVAYSYDVDATDADGDTLSYSLVTAPAGMTIDGASGLIAWTPTTAQIGSHPVSVQVDDGNGGTATQSYTVTVDAAPNTAPSITSTPVTTVTEGEAYGYDVDASDADGDTLSYSLVTAPAGMTIDGASGLIAWTPTTAQIGSHPVSVQADDGNGGTATQSYTVMVDAAPNTAPSITSTPLTTATEGVAYGYDVDASDADGDTLSYSLTTAPAGMTIDSASGLIGWSPTTAQVGSHPVTVQVDDGKGGTASQDYTLVVNAAVNSGPVISSTPPTQATTNMAYSYAVTASDPDGDTLSFSLITAPTGMSIDSATGLVSWTPSSAQAGSHGVTIRVDDSRAYVEQSYSITVSSDALPLDVFISLSSQNVDLGGATTVTVISEGGVQPAALTLTVDGAAVALDGAGQATLPGDAIGTYHLIATATDARETVDARSYYTVRDPADTTAPTAIISTPATDAELTAPAQVIGTADDANLAEYKLLVSPADRNQYTEIAYGTVPVLNGELGTFDPTQLENGIYDVALIVTDVNGLQSSNVVQYQVTGDMKVGNFSFTVEDLSIPVAGIPITVNRTYDTRKRFNDLDFGYGWTIDYQSVKVEENIKLGLNWTLTSSGGLFTNYCIEPVGAHVVTVTLPDGKVEKFDMGVSPSCNLLIPILDVNPVFTARAGTSSELVATDVGILRYNGGTLLDMGDVDVYDSTRYQLTTAEGYVYSLDQNFGIRTVIDPNGNTLTYSSSGIVHSSGKSVTFVRDGQGRITRVTDPNGNHIDYGYNVNGDLASVTNQVGEVTQHRYNRSHGLTEYIDPRGITPARNIYDDEGRLIATEDADGNRIELTHDIAARQEVVRDRLGNVTVLGYDDNGYVTSEIDALGNATSYLRDARGNELSKTDALGNTVTKSFDINDNPLTETDELGNTITRSYNNQNQLLTLTDKNGNVTSNSYDSRGNLTQITDASGNIFTHTFDSSGNVMSMVDANGHATNYSYDADGNVLSETDPLGHAVTYQYDANGNLVGDNQTRTDGSLSVTVSTQKVYDPANRLIAMVDGEGFGSGTEYNALGKVSAKIDKNGNRTEFGYDARGNLIQTRYADGTISSATYDAEGNKVSETDQAGNTTVYEYDALKRLVRTTYADGSQVSNSYDAAGRLIAVTDAHGNITSYEYDAAGQRIRETDPLGNQTSYSYDANGNQISVTDARGQTTAYEYNALNHRIRTIFPDGSQINLTNDALGRKTAETDQAGVITQYAYDALGHLIQVTDALGGLTSYTYDELGNKLTQTDAEGRTTSWTYDNVGNVLSRSLPLGQVETFTYDGNGNKLTHTDFNGDTVSFSYDSLNRSVLKTYPDASTVAYSYTATGKIASVTDASGITDYSYDSRDRLIRVDNPDGSFIAYAYDAMGNRTELTTPAGTVFYTFDALNRLESVTDLSGGATVYSYDAVGNRDRVSHPNGTQASYSYDSLNRLIYLENSRADSTIISSYQYTLGAAGNRTRVVEHNGRTVDYVYDALYRLVSEQVSDLVNGNSRVDYTYDAVGNRLTKVVDSLVTLSYSYDANDRLLTEGATSYTYDANGNLLSKNGGSLTTYSYDVENHLVQVQTPTSTLAYAYDADGIRSSLSVDGIVTKHLVDKNRDYAQVIEERDATDTLLVTYTHGDDLISQDRSGSASYYHYDGLGSTRMLTDSSGTTNNSYTYDAFGLMDHSVENTANEYLFAGEQFDKNLSQYYLRARYYDQNVGRFSQMDEWYGSACNPVTLNKYSYGNSNPVNIIDPSGYFGFSVGGMMTGLNIGARLALSNIGTVARFAVGGTKGKTSIVKFIGCRIGVAYIQKQYRGDGLQGHHGIPKNLGGKHGQDLIFLPANTHHMFHWVLHVLLKNDPELKGMGNWTSKLKWDEISRTPAGRLLLYKNIEMASKVVDKFCRLRPPANLTSFVRRYKKEFLRGM